MAFEPMKWTSVPGVILRRQANQIQVLWIPEPIIKPQTMPYFVQGGRVKAIVSLDSVHFGFIEGHGGHQRQPGARSEPPATSPSPETTFRFVNGSYIDPQIVDSVFYRNDLPPVQESFLGVVDEVGFIRQSLGDDSLPAVRRIPEPFSFLRVVHPVIYKHQLDVEAVDGFHLIPHQGLPRPSVWLPPKTSTVMELAPPEQAAT